MRAPTSAVLLALLLSAAPAAAEEELPLLELRVGEEKVLGGYRPVCDDPTVAKFSEDGRGALKGLKEGETICSISRGSVLGQRSVYRVVVDPKGPQPKPGQGKAPDRD
jgi:hypothetical protein